MTRDPFRADLGIGAAGPLVFAALVGVTALMRRDFTETDGEIRLTLATSPLTSGLP